MMPQPPFSPDLAPSDFYLFGNVKKKMCGATHTCREDAIATFSSVLDGISLQERLDAFVQWMKRLETVIEKGGQYV
jgi:hypothetical protein